MASHNLPIQQLTQILGSRKQLNPQPGKAVHPDAHRTGIPHMMQAPASRYPPFYQSINNSVVIISWIEVIHAEVLLGVLL